MKKNNITKQDLIRIIIYIVFIAFELISASYNAYKLSHLNKYGTALQAVVDSFDYKVKTYHNPKTGSSTFYTAKITYHIKNQTKQKICTFYHKPTVDYSEGSEFQLVTDPIIGFTLPAIEKQAFKRSEINGKFILTGISIFLFILLDFIVFSHKKDKSKNKYIKKLKKKDPEFKAKVEKKEDTQVKVMLILLAPFLFIMGCYYEIKNRITAKKKNKKK